jgi:hypothetical protein
MKRSWVIKEGWIESIIDILEEDSSTLTEIKDQLEYIGLHIGIGEIRTILSAFYVMGIVSRKKTYKKNYKYTLVRPHKIQDITQKK